MTDSHSNAEGKILLRLVSFTLIIILGILISPVTQLAPLNMIEYILCLGLLASHVQSINQVIELRFTSMHSQHMLRLKYFGQTGSLFVL